MDRTTPNLPSRDFQATTDFYAPLGFGMTFRNDNWMILERGGAVIEFFPHPQLRPAESWFSACLRLDDIESFFSAIRAAGLPEARRGNPRFHPPENMSGMMIGALIDLDGSLLRVIAN